MVDSGQIFKFSLILAVTIAVICAAPAAFRWMRTIYSNDGSREEGMRAGTAAALGLVASIALGVYFQFSGKPFQDIFVAVEKVFVWWVMITCVLYVVFCIPDIFRFVRAVPFWRLLLVAAMFPVAFLLTDLVFRKAGFPLLRALMNAWHEWLGGSYDKAQMDLYAPSEGAVKAVTLILWGLTAKHAIEPRAWLVLLPMYALSAIAAAFVPAGLAFVAAAIIVCLLLIVANNFCERYGQAWNYVYKHSCGRLSANEVNEVAKRIM